MGWSYRLIQANLNVTIKNMVSDGKQRSAVQTAATQLPPPREMVQSHNHANQFVSWIYILLASEPFL